ncbi:MAG: PilZ domain-containing protein [Spirochaetes bacterium]|nr:PilZ domain-containing protein [Spirochaetota bacterium]
MERRKNVRFKPDSHFVVLSSGKKNKVEGFIRDESYHGCAAVFRKPFPFKKGSKVKASVGKLQNLNGEIKWVKNMDDVLVKVGIYLV